MPSVSVIIPTYKHRDFVLETLDSVFAQTFTDYEIIVVNDSSPDDTAEVLRPLTEAGRIRYIEQANAGPAAARNRGLAEAQGEYIAFLDDDDLWPPDKLEWQVEAMTRHINAGVIAGPAEVINNAGCHTGKSPFVPEVAFDSLFLGSPLYSPGQALIRASVIKQIHGLNPDLWGSDDWDLWFRIARISTIVMEDRIALFYRVHASNASNQIGRMFDSSCLVLDLYLADIENGTREGLKLSAYRVLYGNLSAALIGQIKAIIKSGKFWLLPPSAALLLKLGRVLSRDSVFASLLVRHILLRRMSRLALVTKPKI